LLNNMKKARHCVQLMVGVRNHDKTLLQTVIFNTDVSKPVLPMHKFPCHELVLERMSFDTPFSTPLALDFCDMDWKQCQNVNLSITNNKEHVSTTDVDNDEKKNDHTILLLPWKKMSMSRYFNIPVEILDATQELQFCDHDSDSFQFLFQHIFPSLGKTETCQIRKIKLDYFEYTVCTFAPPLATPTPLAVTTNEKDNNVRFEKSLRWLSTSPFLATNLRVFDFRCSNCPNDVLDISGIEHAQHLQELSLSGNRIKNIACLAVLYNLCHVDFSDTNVTGIESLSNSAPMLLSLNLTNTLVSDLHPLEKMTRLVKLVLCKCVCIKDIRPIGCLGQSLLFLDLSLATGLLDGTLRPLSELVHLVYLDVSSVRIANYEFVSGMQALEYLNLHNTFGVEFISQPSFPNLQYLKHLKVLMWDDYLCDAYRNEQQRQQQVYQQHLDFYHSFTHITQLDHLGTLSGSFLKDYVQYLAERDHTITPLLSSRRGDGFTHPFENVREIVVYWDPNVPDVNHEVIYEFDKVLYRCWPNTTFRHRYKRHLIVTERQNLINENVISFLNLKFERDFNVRMQRLFFLQCDYDAVVRVAECLLHDLIDSPKEANNTSNKQIIVHLNLENAHAHVVLKNIVARALAVEMNKF